MLAVAQAADEWVQDDRTLVGEWLVSPNDALQGVSPAAIVRRLGRDGVNRLTIGMHRVAPRTPVKEPVLPSERELATLLDELGFPASPGGEAVTDVDLSDFD